MIRVVLVTSNPFNTASRCLPELVASEKIEVVSVMLAEGAPSHETWKLRKRKLRKAMKIGVLGALNGVRIRPWFRSGPSEHIEALCDRWSIPLYRTGALNSDRTVELLRAGDGDLGLSVGNGYIARRVFSVPRFGMINFHGERLPEYQNAQSVIWPIYNMERTTGLTIHEIDDKIDTGQILYKEEYPIEFRASLEDTVTTTALKTASKVGIALRHVCENYDDLRKEARAQVNGRSYTTPSFREFLRMIRNNRKLYEAQPPSGVP